MSEERIEGSAECPGEERLWLLFDGELFEEESKEVREHLSACARCAETWNEIRALGRLLDRDRPSYVAEAHLAERALTAHFRRRFFTRAAAAAALAAGFLLAIAVFGRFHPPDSAGPGPESVAQWDGTSSGPKTEAKGFLRRAPLAAGEKKKVRSGSGVENRNRVRLKCGASCELTEGSVGEALVDSERACVYRLEKGRARFEVPHGTNFSVETPDARVEVLGTIFTVVFQEASRATEVSVERGVVALFSLSGKLLCRIHPGLSASTSSFRGKNASRSGSLPEEPIPLGTGPPAGRAERATDIPEKR